MYNKFIKLYLLKRYCISALKMFNVENLKIKSKLNDLLSYKKLLFLFIFTNNKNFLCMNNKKTIMLKSRTRA